MAILSFRLAIPAVLIAVIPAGIALAQAPAMFHRERPSADTIARLQEGRIAMAKAALKLSDTQLKLWAPVEEQIRAAIADRAKARAEREARQGASTKDLVERLEQRSQAMTQRAERMKAFTAAAMSIEVSSSVPISPSQSPVPRKSKRITGIPACAQARASNTKTRCLPARKAGLPVTTSTPSGDAAAGSWRIP